MSSPGPRRSACAGRQLGAGSSPFSPRRTRRRRRPGLFWEAASTDRGTCSWPRLTRPRSTSTTRTWTLSPGDSMASTRRDHRTRARCAPTHPHLPQCSRRRPTTAPCDGALDALGSASITCARRRRPSSSCGRPLVSCTRRPRASATKLLLLLVDLELSGRVAPETTALTSDTNSVLNLGNVDQPFDWAPMSTGPVRRDACDRVVVGITHH